MNLPDAASVPWAWRGPIKKDQWQFAGVLPLFDPPRDQAKATIASARQMGVNVKMVTGDQMAIAQETARQLGMGANILDASAWATRSLTRRRRRRRPSRKRTALPRYFPSISSTLSMSCRRPATSSA